MCLCSFQKVRKVADEDEDWTPHHEEEVEGDHEGEEGEKEGDDCILRERRSNTSTAEEMDTIARFASHTYYLRSLHKSEVVERKGPKADLQVPSQESGPSRSRSAATESEPRPPLKVGVSRSRAPLPVPILPPPPMPRGQSSADLFQSLDARDEEIRKSK